MLCEGIQSFYLNDQRLRKKKKEYIAITWASDNEGKGSANALGVKEVGELLPTNVLRR